MLYARAATYLRPRAVPTVQASASAAALLAPPRASARTSGVVESKRQADVAAVIVAMVPESVDLCGNQAGIASMAWRTTR